MKREEGERELMKAHISNEKTPLNFRRRYATASIKILQ
jgi:hypothetical protein